MKQYNPLHIAFSDTDNGVTLEVFALLNLGMVQSLASGVVTATEAVQYFYHAENCLYVRNHFRNRQANAIMSHGIQLPDLFDGLPMEEAQREFLHELETMRALCLEILEKVRTLDVVDHSMG